MRRQVIEKNPNLRLEELREEFGYAAKAYAAGPDADKIFFFEALLERSQTLFQMFQASLAAPSSLLCEPVARSHLPGATCLEPLGRTLNLTRLHVYATQVNALPLIVHVGPTFNLPARGQFDLPKQDKMLPESESLALLDLLHARLVRLWNGAVISQLVCSRHAVGSGP